jgi:hypothetical protein
VKCAHEDFVRMVGEALKLYSESICFQSPMGILQVEVELPPRMEYCPWCGEEIEHGSDQSVSEPE